MNHYSPAVAFSRQVGQSHRGTWRIQLQSSHASCCVHKGARLSHKGLCACVPDMGVRALGTVSSVLHKSDKLMRQNRKTSAPCALF
jgi:hypothetical protein